MIYSYDAYQRAERPYTYLAKPNKDYIGTIRTHDLVNDLCFSNMSQATFTVYKYEDGEETPHYNDIENYQLVEISYIGWFQITNVEHVGDGNNEYVEVTAMSLENEAVSKKLTSFGQLGIDSDEQGGLDRYKLYDISDTQHSIMHIWLEKMPSWSVGYIDPDITTEYRTFTNDEVGAYSFLIDDVSTTFECIFQFDTFNQEVSAYKLENIGDITSIFLSHTNVVKKITKKSDASDIITVYTVVGGDDNGTPLGIIEVNIAGTNQITNYSYYKSKMSETLRTRYTEYENECVNRQSLFTTAVEQLKVYTIELNDLNNKVPSDQTSTNWTLYGLTELNLKSDIYKNSMSLFVGKKDSYSVTNYDTNRAFKDAVDAEIKVRKAQISTKESQIDSQRAYINSLMINLHDFLGDTLYKELSRFYHEATFTDDTFVVTSSMTEAEALQMKRDLLEMATKDLAKKCKPSYTIEVDAINFTVIPEFKRYSDQLVLGNIMTLDFGDGVLVESRLLKLHINWDNPSDFSMTFSSKNRLDGFEYQLAEIQSGSSSVTTSYNISGTGWNAAKNTNSMVTDYMKNNFDLQKQKLVNGSGETFVADGTGTLWRRKDDMTNDYSPNQMWGTSNGLFMTQNAWKNVELAIGEGIYNGQTLYGVWAKLLCGEMILGSNLLISNNSANFSITDAGFTAVNGIYSVGLNPSIPSDIINVKVNGEKKFYIDTVNNKLKFAGDLEAVGGTFSGTVQAATIISSSINNGNGTFTVDSNGNMVCNNATLNSAKVSGEINALTGTLGDLTITGILSGGEINGAFIKSASTDGSESTTIQYGRITSSYVELKNSTNLTTLQPNKIKIDGSLQCGFVDCGNGTVQASNLTTNTINNTSIALSHQHDSSEIWAIDTGFGNINFAGSLNACSVTYAQSHFAPLDPSDFRLKKDIFSIDPKILSFFYNIKTKTYKMKDSDEKIHFGIIAQELENNLINNGLSLDYAVCDTIDPRLDTTEGLYVGKDVVHRINYNELISLSIYVIQQHKNEIDKLYEKISILESKLVN